MVIHIAMLRLDFYSFVKSLEIRWHKSSDFNFHFKKIILAILGPLYFSCKYAITFVISTLKVAVRIFSGIALNH